MTAKKPANQSPMVGSNLGQEVPSEPGVVTEPAVQSQQEQTPLDELFALDRTQAKNEQIQDIVNRHITHVTNQTPLPARYNVLVLYDGMSLDRSDANRIYRALGAADRGKPNFLILRSPGGDVGAAYFIGKLCREYTKAAFEVAVPREAKSAATLICCAADRIHMGSLSELGPIDPQFGGMPALAVKHSLEHLSELVTQYPGAREMLSEYLSRSLPINVLGHYERAAGSAVQYAERLLGARLGELGSAARNSEIARGLVYDYKDHGFAIDSREAATILGNTVVRSNSEEYHAANQVYEALDFVEFVLGRLFRRDFSFTGSFDSASFVFARRKR